MKTPLKTNAASESNPPVAVVGRPPVTFRKAVQMAALCRGAAMGLLLAALSLPAQVTPTLNIQQSVSDYADIDPGHPGCERKFILAIENDSPGPDSRYNLISVSLTGFASTSDIYGITLGGDFSSWTMAWSLSSSGGWNLTFTPGIRPLESDGEDNNMFPYGQISFYTPFARLQTNTATALAFGEGAGNRYDFTPVPVVLPDARPELSGCVFTNATVTLTLTNLAPGWSYTVQASPDLVIWTNAHSFTATANGHALTLAASNAPAHFYRVRTP